MGEVKELPHNFIWGIWGWNPHPGCRSRLTAAYKECTLQFKCGKWGSDRPSLIPTDGKQNQRFFVPGALSFQMGMGPISPYLIMHVHSVSTQEAKAMNMCPDTFNVINMKLGGKGKNMSLLPPTIHIQIQFQWTELVILIFIPENSIWIPSHLSHASVNVWGHVTISHGIK